MQRIEARIKKVASEAAQQDSPRKSLVFLQAAYRDRGSFSYMAGVLSAASSFPGPALDAWMRDILKQEKNAALRRVAAKVLGQAGSAAMAPLLTHISRKDPETSDFPGGCIVMRGNAREAAAAALRQLRQRHPEISRTNGWLQK
jgi:HEAT repeat protein